MADFAQALQGLPDEAVEVNQRALIDKVLARYSGENTVFRELLQNADDASATEVEIKFLSSTESDISSPAPSNEPLPDLKTHKIARVVARNNGIPFREQDWSRLRKIAEGNPDESKIGAFGVGFYALWSICDSPIVMSGNSIMGFSWSTKNSDQLVTRKGTNPIGFLATSLAFTTQIKVLSLYFDNHLLCKLEKKLAPPQTLTPPSNLSALAPMQMMKIVAVDQTSVQIDATVLRLTLQGLNTRAKTTPFSAAGAAATTSSFASRMLSAFTSKSTPSVSPSLSPAPTETPINAEPLTRLKASLFLRVVTGNVNDEFDAGKETSADDSGSKRLIGDKRARAVFDGLISDLEVQGRVFIGFPTHQTTGFSGSIAARFIPTVERESLDLQAKYVADWNKELLAIGGILARMIYEALHAMQFFTFHSSTPAGTVSFDTEQSFFQCDRNRTITVPSSSGPQSAINVRLPNPELATFLKNIPVIPMEVTKNAQLMITKLRERRLISEISLEDVFKELENRVFDVDEMRECMTWWIGLTGLQGYDRSIVQRFLRCAVFQYPPTSPASTADSLPASNTAPVVAEVIMPMSSVKTFINVKLIPADVPTPPHCLPFALTKSMSSDSLKRVFGFNELNLLDFTTHLFSAEFSGVDSISESPVLAEKFLNILAKAWSSLSAELQREISSYLQEKVFIPTRHGMRKSSEAYHSNVTLFQDLAVVCLPSGTPVKGAMEKVLTAIGVRKHVELQMVFSRLLGSGEWNHADLVKYLVSVRDILTDVEVDRLKHTNWLPKDGEPKLGKPKTIRYAASQLYEPTPANRELQLPLVEWPVKWRSTSEEAKLLFFLGLNKIPPIDVLLKIAANAQDGFLRENALAFFLEHFADYRFSYRPDSQTPSYVPCTTGLVNPLECYSNPEASVMGFPVLQDKYMADYQKFGLKQNPSSAQLVKRLIDQPPSDTTKAKQIYEYLSTRVADFSQSELSRLKNASIIPVTKGSHASPSTCFFQPQNSVKSGPFKSLFTYIDFGLASKPFLRACGVKNEPTVQEITEMLIADPAKFYALAGSAEEYLQVLRNIAANSHLLGHGLKQAMQRSAFILGSRRVSPSGTTGEKALVYEDDDDEIEAGQPFVHVLALPRDVEVFEHLAESLGASRLTKILKEKFHIEGVNPENERTREMRQLIIERCHLFLYERQGVRNDVVRDAEWMKRNLVVKQVEHLALQRDLIYLGTKHSSVLQATATASMESRNTMVIYLARKTEIDWFELASTVCKHILAHQKLSDSLFFMTILQTSLKNLKRRGVNVDRIINARKAEREANQQRLREEKLQMQLDSANELTPDKLESQSQELEKRFPDADPDFIRQALLSEKEDHLKRVSEKFQHGAYKKKPVAPTVPEISPQHSGLFSSLRRKLLNNETTSSKPHSPLAGETSPHPPSLEGPRPKSLLPPPSQATPMSDIRSNLIKAINVSRPDTNSDIRSKPDTKPVKESEQSYCDPSGAREDLSFLTTVGGLRFYVSRQVTSGEMVMMEYGDALNRYVEKVIKPVGEVFDIDPRSLHVFYDLEGPVIAFNKNGSLFFNLRYYLAWYDDHVKKGILADALIGTFSSFAHELAHNLVTDHNSEHEWWMSSFIEQYFLRIAAHIASVVPVPSVE
ncbi:hypothetical protein DFH28DRAFT_941666 [Melampsora americana]|nr:hypothetical protein DFH28DRAFT_941666 [Melampsora americana]